MKKFTIITKDGSKWLRRYHPDEVIYGEPRRHTLVPYIGSRPEGTTLDESDVIEVRQSYNTLMGRWEDSTPDDWACNIRTAYTDAESHGSHIRPFNTQNVRPLVNQLVGEEISFSRFIELLNEIANTH